MTVSGVSILPVIFQPQPVFSSSNGCSLPMRRRGSRCTSAGRTDDRRLRMKPSPPSKTANFMPSSLAATLTGSSDFAFSAALTNIRISLTARG